MVKNIEKTWEEWGNMVKDRQFIEIRIASLREKYGLHHPMEISFADFLKQEAKWLSDRKKAAKELGIELAADGSFGRYGGYEL